MKPTCTAPSFEFVPAPDLLLSHQHTSRSSSNHTALVVKPYPSQFAHAGELSLYPYSFINEGSRMQVDLLDRLVIIRTLPYSLEEAVQILAVRAEVSHSRCTAASSCPD